ncbi:hypothetical protein Zmor_003500 [Zophobas morio]|uniref:Uncharacterized protein n=1 Tax=Zophobas morio TaxID=2755281 RepID=A0AA38HLZ0_9CUCU|nr:hypothetical protein Zmor_003500 [Zophobas morio]
MAFFARGGSGKKVTYAVSAGLCPRMERRLNYNNCFMPRVTRRVEGVAKFGVSSRLVHTSQKFSGEIPVLPFVDKVKAALLTCFNMVIILTYKTSSTFLVIDK